MGRPPCCEKLGVKKGPWTPEEDIILVSYIQEHGPGNWRAVPTNTGLLRCSKSCRLRWTNYLRPGIKRGSFTDKEEKMIIHLQALLGNRWAAIASYLPQRTDNDIKNYWNTHLKKMLNKCQGHGHDDEHDHGVLNSESSSSVSKGQWERRLQTDIHMAKQALCEALSLDKSSSTSSTLSNFPAAASSSKLPPPTSTGFSLKKSNANLIPQSSGPLPVQTSSTYASSTENIARLLQNWMKKSPKSSSQHETNSSEDTTAHNNQVGTAGYSTPSEGRTPEGECAGFESLFSFNSFNSSSDVSMDDAANFATPESNGLLFQNDNSKPNFNNQQMPLTLLEKWLFDDAAATQGQEDLIMNMSSTFGGETSDHGFF